VTAHHLNLHNRSGSKAQGDGWVAGVLPQQAECVGFASELQGEVAVLRLKAHFNLGGGQKKGPVGYTHL
jgi:hypothetical protein